MRGRLTALDAKTGKILWRFYTLPGPGEVGAETWPAGNDQYSHGGAAIWNLPFARESILTVNSAAEGEDVRPLRLSPYLDERQRMGLSK